MDSGIEEFKKFVNPVPYESNKEDCAICKRCAMTRPVCCQMLPCHIAPVDIKDLSFQGIVALIERSGIVSIDWYDGEESSSFSCLREEGPHFFLRMRGDGRKVIDPGMILTRCMLWDEDNGCPIHFSYRPKGARELIPNKDIEKNCEMGYTKEECAAEWSQYQEVLHQVVNLYMMKGDFESMDPLSMLSNVMESLCELERLSYKYEESV